MAEIFRQKHKNPITGRLISKKRSIINLLIKPGHLQVPAGYVLNHLGNVVKGTSRNIRKIYAANYRLDNRRHAFKIPSLILDLSALTNKIMLEPTQINKIERHINKYKLKWPLTFKIRDPSSQFKFTINFPNHEAFIGWLRSHRQDNGYYQGQQIGEEFNVAFRNAIVDIIPQSLQGGCARASGNKVLASALIGNQHLTIVNAKVIRNNCGIAAIKYFIKELPSAHICRKGINRAANEKLSIEEIYTLYNKYNKSNKKLKVITRECKEYIDCCKYNYILFRNDHYVAVKFNAFVKENNKKVNRGFMAIDFETRMSEEDHIMVGDNKMVILKDTICSVAYYPLRSNERKEKIFRTTKDKSSCRQLIDFLISESLEGRHYHVNAYNGSRFDFYLIYGELRQDELVYSDIQLRGMSILSFGLFNHRFTDLSNFLVGSLANKCKAFGIEDGKMTQTKYGSSTDLCYYKPNLSFDEFMELRNKEPEYWEEYEKYCLQDSIALLSLWKKFIEAITKISQRVNPIFARAVYQFSTIGSFAKKLFLSSVSKNPYALYEKFIGKDSDKYDFIRNCIRGGISYSTQCGEVKESVSLLDIVSQYPASMMEMLVAVGYSKWIKEYKPDYQGYLHFQYIKFTNSNFKPVATKFEDNTLNWCAKEAKDIYMSTEMFKNLLENNEIEEYKLLCGLVSKRNQTMKGSVLFGNYVMPFFNEKRNQDKLKKEGAQDYNPALRECCKLFLNCLSGKLVENPNIYKDNKVVSAKPLCGAVKEFNGIYINEKNQDKQNPLVQLGVSMYDYSKILLFKTVRQVGPENILNSETDSIFFLTKYIDRVDKEVFGKELGQMDIEGSSDTTVFCRKKMYYFNDKKCALKGIPQYTLDENMKKFKVYDREHFVKIAKGESVVFTFSTIKKQLYGKKTALYGGRQQRVISI